MRALLKEDREAVAEVEVAAPTAETDEVAERRKGSREWKDSGIWAGRSSYKGKAFYVWAQVYEIGTYMNSLLILSNPRMVIIPPKIRNA